MTMATLSEVLRPALAQGRAVAGLVVLGWEDAVAFVEAAEAEGQPVILQAGPNCRRHTPLAVMGAMFRALGEGAGVPVVAHLDHGEGPEVCQAAIDCGFTSVMFDGSALPLARNVARTAEVVALARKAGVSVEAELGVVGYSGGAASVATSPAEAAEMAATGIDALAVSVGNLHLMQEASARIDVEALARIAAAVPGLPLVLHGASGVPAAMRQRLARGTALCKFNVGTELRMIWGRALREAVNRDGSRFDRTAILSETVAPLREAARAVIRGLT